MRPVPGSITNTYRPRPTQSLLISTAVGGGGEGELAAAHLYSGEPSVSESQSSYWPRRESWFLLWMPTRPTERAWPRSICSQGLVLEREISLVVLPDDVWQN